MENTIKVGAEENQVYRLAQIAIAFVNERIGVIPPEVTKRVARILMDDMASLAGMLGKGDNDVKHVRAWNQQFAVSQAVKGHLAKMFGSDLKLHPMFAVHADVAAARWVDDNPTIFGVDKRHGMNAGEFAHTEWLQAIRIACQMQGFDGAQMLRAMTIYTEIHCRLCAAFSLKSYQLDHVTHGMVATEIVYMAVMGATAEQIDQAVDLCLNHAIAIRSGRNAAPGSEMGYSKSISAAYAAEFAVKVAHQVMDFGFQGGGNAFQNSCGIFLVNEKRLVEDLISSPFDLYITVAGPPEHWGVMEGFHQKLWGAHEHQIASVLDQVWQLATQNDCDLLKAGGDSIESLSFNIYSTAAKIICMPEKWEPKTYADADHSAPFIIATALDMLYSAYEQRRAVTREDMFFSHEAYNDDALDPSKNPWVWGFINKIQCHRKEEYDSMYPDGIPSDTTIVYHRGLLRDIKLESGLLLYPVGHAKNTDFAVCDEMLLYKIGRKLTPVLGEEGAAEFLAKLQRIEEISAEELADLGNVKLIHYDEAA